MRVSFGDATGMGQGRDQAPRHAWPHVSPPRRLRVQMQAAFVASERTAVAWIQGDGACAQRLDLVHLCKTGPADRLAGAQPQLLRGQALDGPGADAAKLVHQDRSLDTAHDRACHVLLQGEGVLVRAAESGLASMTRRAGNRASAVAISATRPSAKSSPAVVPVGSVKGATATENVSGVAGGCEIDRDLLDSGVGVGPASNSATLAATLFHPVAAGSPCQPARSTHWTWSKGIDGPGLAQTFFDDIGIGAMRRYRVIKPHVVAKVAQDRGDLLRLPGGRARVRNEDVRHGRTLPQ